MMGSLKRLKRNDLNCITLYAYLKKSKCQIDACHNAN